MDSWAISSNFDGFWGIFEGFWAILMDYLRDFWWIFDGFFRISEGFFGIFQDFFETAETGRKLFVALRWDSIDSRLTMESDGLAELLNQFAAPTDKKLKNYSAG